MYICKVQFWKIIHYYFILFCFFSDENSAAAQPTAATSSQTARASVYNNSQYNNNHYEPYYALYDDDVELYRDAGKYFIVTFSSLTLSQFEDSPKHSKSLSVLDFETFTLPND